MKRFQFKVEYDGSRYAGWQVQDNAPTIQGKIETALRDFNQGHLVRIHGSGRTDAGVHALGQVAHFDLETHLSPKDIANAINAKTPDDIFIYDCREIDNQLHSRFDAKRRTYIYKLTTRYSPLFRQFQWFVKWRLDETLLQKCATLIEGKHNFGAFCKTADQADSKVCFIYNSVWKKEENLLTYEISGTRFLHSMVRMLVGTMIEVGRGKRTVGDFQNLLDNKINHDNRYTAPAHGLFLASVDYSDQPVF